MNERGTQMVSVRIGTDNVHIDSQLKFKDSIVPVENARETYNTVAEAKQKLESMRKLYQRFELGYRALETGELALFLASAGKGVVDLFQNGDALGGDLLRVLGVIGVGLATIVAEITADDNKVKTKNKLSAIEKAEEKNVNHYHDVYPFY